MMMVTYTKDIYEEALKCIEQGVESPSIFVSEMIRLIQQYGKKPFDDNSVWGE